MKIRPTKRNLVAALTASFFLFSLAGKNLTPLLLSWFHGHHHDVHIDYVHGSPQVRLSHEPHDVVSEAENPGSHLEQHPEEHHYQEFGSDADFLRTAKIAPELTVSNNFPSPAFFAVFSRPAVPRISRGDPPSDRLMTRIRSVVILV